MAARVPTFVADIAAVLRFYSRLPVPALPGETDPHGVPDFSRLARAVPLAGAVLGAIGALALASAHGIGLSAFVAAAVAVAVLIVATGAFHEDGLADSADGLGGGATKERKLEIMKDSRIGTYGAVALVLGLLLRVGLLADILTRFGPASAACALIAAAAVSRTAALWLGYALPPARTSGAAFAAGRPSDAAFLQAILAAVLIQLVLIWPSAGLFAAVAGLAGAALAAYLTGRLAASQLGGQTGDLAGAAQQAAEILLLAALVLAHRQV